MRRASLRGAHSEADIFGVHRALLEDPPQVAAARELVSSGESVEHAWRNVLAHLDDRMPTERAADLRDIERRVLRALGHSVSPCLDLAAAEFTRPTSPCLIANGSTRRL